MQRHVVCGDLARGELPRRRGHPSGASTRVQWLRYRAVPMDWRDRISADPRVLVGKPVIKGTRIAVEHILGALAAGWSHAQLLASYPGLSEDDILACLAYAQGVVEQERVFPLA